MIVYKLREIGIKKEIASKFTNNFDEVIRFLIEQKWTVNDMVGHNWFKHKFGSWCYGPKASSVSDLRNAKGVHIIPQIGVYIGFWTEGGIPLNPSVHCTKDGFKIVE